MSVPGENSQQDANFEESSAPQTIQTDSQPTNNEAQAQSAESESQSEKQVPFHEHPRFKELIESRRQSEERIAQYEQRMSDMQKQYQETLSRIPQPAKEKNPFIAKLEEIDPSYGKTMEEIYSKANAVDEVRQELAAMKQQAFTSQAVSQINSLHEQNKLAPEARELYNEALETAYATGKIKSLGDVQTIYKAVHERYSKFIDGVKRAERASYVTDKSRDAKAPTSQPKGKMPTSRNEKGQFTGDREADLAMVVSRALKRSKAASDL